MTSTVHRCADVLIIGAGPAGSAAAIDLAKGGASVILADRQDFPRDKVCGDALIPDALNALDHLSLRTAVLERARVLEKIRVYAPNGRFVLISGPCACLSRAILDDIIRSEAVKRGAQFLSDCRLQQALTNDQSVNGANFITRDGRSITVEAKMTILATGAAADPLRCFNVCERVGPSATAARIYVQSTAHFAQEFDHLCISYDQTICPGYGWIFPGPAGVFNVGVGYYYDARTAPPETNVRLLLNRFLETFPPAIELMRCARPLSSLKGAPLRTALAGAKLARRGLLVVGEAAGLTYSFSGEGIGKAMESGVMAAEVILKHSRAGDRNAADIAEEYAARIRAAFAARFKAYKIAQDWLSIPSVSNLLAWRARHSGFVQQQLEGLFQETVNPRELFSASGVVRSLFS